MKNKNIPTVEAKVEKLYVIPTFITYTACPHCKYSNFFEVEEENIKATLTHPCEACGKDYNVYVPYFKTSKQ